MILQTRKFEKNIIAFIKANQEAELANEGDDLRPFTFPDENLANKDKPNLPVLLVTGKRKETAEEDLLVVRWTIRFKSIVGSDSASAIGELTDIYHDALESLLKKIDGAALLADVGQQIAFQDLIQVDSTIDEKASNATDTAFFQQFEMSATYTLFASAY